MTTKYFRDAEGRYLGGVSVELDPPSGGIEVPEPPADARAIWDVVADAWIEPGPILPNLSARQLRLMLLSIGISSAMVGAEIAAIADETERAAAEIEWEYASTYERTHPLIDQMAEAFELPAPQVDALWIAAADL